MANIRNNALWNEKFSLDAGKTKKKLLKCRGGNKITGYIRDGGNVKVDIQWLNPKADNPLNSDYNKNEGVLGANGKINQDVASPWFYIVIENISNTPKEITANVQVT